MVRVIVDVIVTSPACPLASAGWTEFEGVMMAEEGLGCQSPQTWLDEAMAAEELLAAWKEMVSMEILLQSSHPCDGKLDALTCGRLLMIITGAVVETPRVWDDVLMGVVGAWAPVLFLRGPVSEGFGSADGAGVEGEADNAVLLVETTEAKPVIELEWL